MDLVKLASGLATPELITRVAGLVGSTPEQARTGLDAAVPAVLAGILGADGKSDAMAALDTALSRAGELDGFLGQDPALAATTASEMLAPVLGGGAVGPLETALGGYARLPTAGAGTLVGLAGALALGAIDKAAGGEKLDAAGAVGLVRGQRDAITAALPPVFARALGGTGLLAGLGAHRVAAPRPSNERPGRRRRRRPLAEIARLQWVAGPILLAAVVWFGLKLVGPSAEIPVAPVTAVGAGRRSADGRLHRRRG